MRSTIALLLLARRQVRETGARPRSGPKCSRASTTSQHKYDKQEHASSAPIVEPPLVPAAYRESSKAWRRYKPWPNR